MSGHVFSVTWWIVFNYWILMKPTATTTATTTTMAVKLFQSRTQSATFSHNSDRGGGGGEGTSSVTEFDGYYSDWNTMGNRPTQPTCVDIPKNMSLCHNIGYTKMRLPNLLDHDTLNEALQQSNSWIPLLNIECHPDTQLFLCSLFSPVCLDRPIYPCRSLCDKVKEGCEGRMRAYGYPWPDMLKCDKFPLDNDMCITAQSTEQPNVRKFGEETNACSACHQVPTYENILDNFCRADFALKTKIRKIKKSRIICKKSKIFKSGGKLDRKDTRAIRKPKFILNNVDECCNEVAKKLKAHYLIMGHKNGNDLIPTFIMEWSPDSSPFKKAIKRFKSLDCTNPKIVSESIAVDGALTVESPFKSSSSSSSSQDVNTDSQLPSSVLMNSNRFGTSSHANGNPLTTSASTARRPRKANRNKKTNNGGGGGQLFTPSNVTFVGGRPRTNS